jgi:hypothetical protein
MARGRRKKGTSSVSGKALTVRLKLSQFGVQDCPLRKARFMK